ncbi:restriction endonuclease subunit S [Bacteroides congonensis]|uniref:restriction endonuclease subunit S n=1 Tax=Bacteroides congonensis TaxID=1871006 RepID=UPI00189D3269|nr:restriction endonuclease subunit S [Bacteroides congonensis]
MKKWKEYKYTEIASLIGGGTPQTTKKAYWNGRIPWLSVKDFCGGSKYVYNTEKTITDLGLINSSTKLLNKDDIIISARGTVGEIAMLPFEMAFNQSCFGIRANNNRILPDYLYYLTKTKVRELQHASHGAVFNTITKNTFENIICQIPPLEQQKQISTILSSLDDKIELNRRINDNLEQQAQALFKSWFVDFEPFRGGKFVESQLGMIPKGWKVGTLSDLLDIRYGKDHKKLNDGNIPVYGSGGIMRLADGILYNGESVLIPRKGTLNNVLYVNWPFWTVDTMFYSIEKVPNVAKYCHLLLSKLDLASMNSGSAVPSMTTDILNKIQIIVANQDVFSSFNECISSLYLKAKINLDENKRLSETRDLLLPKLMSGRLIIKDLHS